MRVLVIMIKKANKIYYKMLKIEIESYLYHIPGSLTCLLDRVKTCVYPILHKVVPEINPQ